MTDSNGNEHLQHGSSQKVSSYKQVLQTISLMEKYGINIEDSRFLEIQEKLKEFDGVLSDRKAYLVTELAELSYIIDRLESRLLELAPRFKHALQGSQFLDDEEEYTSPRDYIFEIFMISKLISAGFNVSLTGDEDARLTFNGRHIFVECKRVSSYRKVLKNLSKALIQISNRFETESDLGIVALSLTKIAWRKYIKDSICKSLGEAQQIAQEIYNDYRTKLANTLHENPRTILIFVHISIPFCGEDNMLFTYDRFFLRQHSHYQDQDVETITKTLTDQFLKSYP